jgi:hypothetical protein
MLEPGGVISEPATAAIHKKRLGDQRVSAPPRWWDWFGLTITQRAAWLISSIRYWRHAMEFARWARQGHRPGFDVKGAAN